MSRKEDEEVERFRTVVSEQLLGQFKEAHKDRQEILRELQEYASLLVVIRNMQNNKADKINIRASLGHQVFVNAELDKRDTIIVKLGGDLFAELKLERAEEFVTKKLDESAIRSLITIGCRGKVKPKSIDHNAIRLMTALTNALVKETLLRAAQHARREGRSKVTINDLQHILPGILFDFSA